MDRCPLCESFALVTVGKPCYFCGFAWFELEDGTRVARVPGHFLLDLAEPAVAQTVVDRLSPCTRHVVIDFDQFRSLSSAGISLILATRDTAKRNGVEFALSNVSANMKKLLQVCRLENEFRILEDGQ